MSIFFLSFFFFLAQAVSSQLLFSATFLWSLHLKASVLSRPVTFGGLLMIVSRG